MSHARDDVRLGPRRGAAQARTVRWSKDTTGEDLRRGLRFVLLVVSIVVLSGALPAFLLAEVPDSPRSEAWILTLGIMMWAGVRLSGVWVNGTPRLFDFFFWLFVYIFMGLAPTAQIRSGLTSTTTPGIDPGIDMLTAGTVGLGIVCYEVGRLLWMLRESHRRPHREPLVRPVDSRRTILLSFVALALSAYVISQLGVIALLGSREAAVAARAAAWPDPATRAFIYATGVYPLLVAVGALAQLRKTARTLEGRRIALASAIVGACALLLIVNPVTSARYAFGTVAFALLAYMGAVATRRLARITMLGTVFGFLFLFPLADTFRRASGETATRTGFFDEYLANPDYDAFWQVSNALSYWLDGLVQPMNQFLGSILFWVPRSIWPDKPTDTGIMLANYRGYTFDNLSAPLWAEAVVNGGIAAVVIVFLIVGIGFRAMDTRIIPALRRGGVWAIVGAILPVYTTILLRGSLLQATGALILTIGCIVFVMGRRPDKRSAADVAGVRAIPLDRSTKTL